MAVHRVAKPRARSSTRCARIARLCSCACGRSLIQLVCLINIAFALNFLVTRRCSRVARFQHPSAPQPPFRTQLAARSPVLPPAPGPPHQNASVQRVAPLREKRPPLRPPLRPPAPPPPPPPPPPHGNKPPRAHPPKKAAQATAASLLAAAKRAAAARAVAARAAVAAKAARAAAAERDGAGTLILGFSVHGGVGNQIYDMLEALYLARHTGAEMLLPAVLPRTDVEGEASSPNARSGAHVWDVRQLAAGTRGRAIYPYLPARCGGRLHAVYLFARRNGAQPRPTVPAEVRHAACALAAAGPRPSPAPEFGPDACDALFARTSLRIRRQNLTAGGDPSFLRELKALRSRAKKVPVCVWVSGHSYDRAGSHGDEYLYAHMHFLDAHPRFAAAARRWPLNALAVVHVRYDEELCDADDHDVSHVCVRAHKDGPARNANPPVYWAPIDEYVQALVKTVTKVQIKSLYIAASPYVPVKTVMKLREMFAHHVRVERMASTVFDDEADINFLERELAIRARVFIGDFGSTWSGTVYFKRRTAGKSTRWANVVLGKAYNLGYYAHNTSLGIPN